MNYISCRKRGGMPPFLMPLVERIKGSVEKKGNDVKDSIGKKEEENKRDDRR